MFSLKCAILKDCQWKDPETEFPVSFSCVILPYMSFFHFLFVFINSIIVRIFVRCIVQWLSANSVPCSLTPSIRPSIRQSSWWCSECVLSLLDVQIEAQKPFQFYKWPDPPRLKTFKSQKGRESARNVRRRARQSPPWHALLRHRNRKCNYSTGK